MMSIKAFSEQSDRMSKTPEISFIVVTHNGGEMLRKSLAAISKQECVRFEVIVVDNGSTDGSLDLPLFNSDKWQRIRLNENRGFAEANNIAIR